MSFVSALFAEFAARRRRLRAAAGERGQSLIEMAILGGLVLGSFGLFILPWMARAAPWGLAVPVIFMLGYGALDWRRQQALTTATPEAAPRVMRRHDIAALLFSLACAGAGAAAFVTGFNAPPRTAPPPPVEEVWQPPPDALELEIAPDP